MWKYVSYILNVKITHQFLEKNHTQSDGKNSVNTWIENSNKGKKIYVSF